jgi:UDP-glucose 4-epimerase
LSHFLVTGCAGFIGSNLVERLLSLGHLVTGVDNLCTGHVRFLDRARTSSNFRFCEFDLFENQPLSKDIFRNVDLVFHLAANADVRFGTDHPRRDLEQNTIVTFNVLEAMRRNGVTKIVFSSTGSVYGEADVIPTPETAPFPVQTSLYGASKVAGESLISAYCQGFGFQCWIFRFVSILGERYTHGHVYDFYKKLMLDPTRLQVLGNGLQRKSYLYVQDCIDAILLAVEKAKHKVNIFNLGIDDHCEVNDSVSWICEELGLHPKIEYSGGDRGWVGDNPFIRLDVSRIFELGWKPSMGIREAVIKTIKFLRDNKWVFEARG